MMNEILQHCRLQTCQFSYSNKNAHIGEKSQVPVPNEKISADCTQGEGVGASRKKVYTFGITSVGVDLKCKMPEIRQNLELWEP